MHLNSEITLPLNPIEIQEDLKKCIFNHSLYDEIIIIIPAFKPNKNLITMIQSLQTNNNYKIIVIDDGSGNEFDSIFKLIPSNVHIIKHAVNLGKGAALKSAFNYALIHFPNLKGVVTADADGQHLPNDIIHICNTLSDSQKKLIIGSRIFKDSRHENLKIPLRSKLGNLITRWVFKFCVGRNLSDTQSGLRGLDIKLLPSLMKINSNRYDFELEMLIKAREHGYDYEEIPIETVYLENNESSHFNPLLDSFKIYFVLLRYVSTSLISALIDNIIFAIIMFFSSSLTTSMILARIISGTFQFSVNKSVVFKSGENLYQEVFKYILVLITIFIFSYIFTAFFVKTGLSAYSSKLIAESIIFIFTFILQRFFVFNNKNIT